MDSTRTSCARYLRNKRKVYTYVAQQNFHSSVALPRGENWKVTSRLRRWKSGRRYTKNTIYAGTGPTGNSTDEERIIYFPAWKYRVLRVLAKGTRDTWKLIRASGALASCVFVHFTGQRTRRNFERVNGGVGER